MHSKLHSLPITGRVFTQDNSNSTYLELAVRISRVDLLKSLTRVIFTAYIRMTGYPQEKKQTVGGHTCTEKMIIFRMQYS